MRTALPASTRYRGFTLIELMVSMALGLMTTVIIAEVMLKSEGNRRTTTEGSDAQLSGALALYAIERDVQMAGYGIISTKSVLGCTVKGQYASHAAQSFTLAPVQIESGGSPNVSDKITVLYSGSNRGYAVPIVTAAAHGQTDSAFTVQSALDLKEGDTMLAMPLAPDANHWCTMFTVKASAGNALTLTTIPHVTATDNWNPGTSLMPASYASGSMLAKINEMVYRQYEVTNSDLVATDRYATDKDEVSTNTVGTQVVLMKAFYGVDTTGDGTVDAYTATTPTTTAGWQQIKTVRIAVVARSAQRERELVTQADPVWDVGTLETGGAVTCGTHKCVTLQVSPDQADDTEWQHYRYKVFDTVIPLRNMLWTS